MAENFWARSSDEWFSSLKVDPSKGLTRGEAEKRLEKYGRNILKPKRRGGALFLFFSQFNSPLIYLLLFAALLSAFLYQRTDAFIIFFILLVSAFLSFFQEMSANKAMGKLLKVVSIKSTLLRDGKLMEISVEKIVPGDIIEFNAGDIVPSDCLLLESKDLFVDEAALTGESFYAEKSPGTLAVDTPLSKRQNSLFMGTHVVSGTARAVVIATGKETLFGALSESLKASVPETEFERGVRHFGYFLMEVTAVLVLLIFAFNVYLERSVIESMLFSLALAVGLTPQLLPAIITINLSHGAREMAKKKVIVKKLASIENFGSMDVLCADKTGTLTKGVLTLFKALNSQGQESKKVLSLAALNAYYQTGYTNPIDKALSPLLEKEKAIYTKIDELPYDFVRKRLSILLHHDHAPLMITKGSFSQILAISSHVEGENGQVVSIEGHEKELEALFVKYSQEGSRVISVAYKEAPTLQTLALQDETQMVFAGFILFQDALKEGVTEAIDDLQKLGVSLKIITGDNKYVAHHVAKALGITSEAILTGPEIRHLSDRALLHQVNKKRLFAEIEPNQKERIILALRHSGHVVGFMGDGINDVTALHASDVSLSPDSAVDIAKEVADIVLLEKDLQVLRDGVKEGRRTFANTLKYIFMATSANFGNMFSMAGASLFLPFLPLLPKQILLTNLLTDCPEMAIATDSVDQAMLEKPLRWNLAFIRKFMVVFGLISSLFDYATFGLLLWIGASTTQFRTGWFVESVLSATAIVLVIRTFKPFYKSRPSLFLGAMCIAVICITPLLSLTPLASYLSLQTLPLSFYGMIALIVLLYIVLVEKVKGLFFAKMNHKKKGQRGELYTPG